MAVVEVRHLRKYYGNKRGAEDVSFAIDENRIFGMVGPNGAGKTTTIECALGIRGRDAGSVTILGNDPLKHRSRVFSRVRKHHPVRTVSGAAAEGAHGHTVDPWDKAAEDVFTRCRVGRSTHPRAGADRGHHNRGGGSPAQFSVGMTRAPMFSGRTEP